MPKNENEKRDKIVRKITPSLCAREQEPWNGEMIVLGVVRRYEDIPTPYGTSACFRGDFGAQYKEPLTGEPVRVRSNKLYLPRHVESMLVEAVDAAQHGAMNEKTGEILPVEVAFGFKLWQTEAKSKGKGMRVPYEWNVEALFDTRTQAADRVEKMLAEYEALAQRLARLPAEGT